MAALDLAEPVGGEPLRVRVFKSRPPAPVRTAGPVADDWLARLQMTVEAGAGGGDAITVGDEVAVLWQCYLAFSPTSTCTP